MILFIPTHSVYRLPKAPALEISSELQEYCRSVQETTANNSASILLIKGILSQLMGISPENIHLPLANSDVQRKPLSVGIGLPPVETKRLRNGSVGNNLSGMRVPPPPRLLKRTKSVGVHQVSTVRARDCARKDFI